MVQTERPESRAHLLASQLASFRQKLWLRLRLAKPRRAPTPGQSSIKQIRVGSIDRVPESGVFGVGGDL